MRPFRVVDATAIRTGLDIVLVRYHAAESSGSRRSRRQFGTYPYIGISDRSGRLGENIARQIRLFCTAHLAVTEGPPTAPNGGSRAVAVASDNYAVR